MIDSFLSLLVPSHLISICFETRVSVWHQTLLNIQPSDSCIDRHCGTCRAFFTMDDNSVVRVTGIRHIVRLKEILQKWQTITLSSKRSPLKSGRLQYGIPPAVNKRLNAKTASDSDEESCHNTELPADVPKGYLAVYVGPELRRFIIPTAYLSHSLFKVLLEKVEEEFGFNHCGGLTIPCEIETFKYLLKCMENHQNNDHPHEFTAERPLSIEG